MLRGLGLSVAPRVSVRRWPWARRQQGPALRGAGWSWMRVGGTGSPLVLTLLLSPSPQGLQGFQGDRGLAGEKGEEVSWLSLAQPLGAVGTTQCQPQPQHVRSMPSSKNFSLLVSPVPHQQRLVPTSPPARASLMSRYGVGCPIATLQPCGTQLVATLAAVPTRPLAVPVPVLPAAPVQVTAVPFQAVPGLCQPGCQMSIKK